MRMSPGAVIALAALPLLPTFQSCSYPTAPPSGTYKIDAVKFVPSNPNPVAASPVPNVWIDTHIELSSLSGGTMKSYLPYGAKIDYTDNSAEYQAVDFTSVKVTYDDSTVDAATNDLNLPLRITARQVELVNSMNGGQIVKSKVQVISGEIPDVITRSQPLTLSLEGHFTKRNGDKVPFAIEQHYDIEIEDTTKSAAEVLQDK